MRVAAEQWLTICVLGENDVHVILDLPENLIAAAISLAVMSKGATIFYLSGSRWR
jgi:uncharacterized protein with GYD domain